MLLQENDEVRLNKMNYYCLTKDCLRHYILNYFGEQVSGRCEKCGNCQAEYEEKDVTDICRDIIHCVEQLRQRYRMNVIVDTLLGRNKAKIRSLGLESTPSFGICKGEKEAFLKNIINELEQQGFLLPTKDKYMVLKLSQSCREIQNGERQVFIKVSKEELQTQTTETKKASKRKSDLLTGKGLELFDVLREFRLALAKEEAVPPYIICSDKTLTDMCVKLPKNKQEMLNVNGIGESKYEKYGERFIEKIREFTHGEEMTLYYEEALIEQEPIAEEKTTKRKGKKSEFSLTAEIEQQIQYTQQTTISDFVKQLNQYRNEDTIKCLSTTFITRKLVEEGYLKEEIVDGKSWKRTLKKGEDIGICEETRQSQYGKEYQVLLYTKPAQEFLINSLRDRWQI